MLAPASLVHYSIIIIIIVQRMGLVYSLSAKWAMHIMLLCHTEKLWTFVLHNYVQKPVQIIMHNNVLCYINQKAVHIILFYINFVLHKLAE